MLVVIDVRPNVEGLPTSAYRAIEQIETRESGKEINRVFKHIPSSIEAEEAEGVMPFCQHHNVYGVMSTAAVCVCVCVIIRLA